jgi:hypothetical protein
MYFAQIKNCIQDKIKTHEDLNETMSLRVCSLGRKIQSMRRMVPTSVMYCYPFPKIMTPQNIQKLHIYHSCRGSRPFGTET